MNDDPNGNGVTIRVIGSGRANMEMLSRMSGEAPPPVAIIDPIEQAPVLHGPHGKAWRCDREAALLSRGIDPAEDGTLDHWIIEAPSYHPAWHSYSLCLVHLRPLRTPRRTLFYLEGATHELWLYALDPGADRRRTLATGIPAWLTPANYVGQFIEISDDLARARIGETVQDICDGRLSPDTDHVSSWKARFGDHLFKDREKPIIAREVLA